MAAGKLGGPQARLDDTTGITEGALPPYYSTLTTINWTSFPVNVTRLSQLHSPFDRLLLWLFQRFF